MVKLQREERIFMKKSKYSAEEVTFALRQAESGTPVPEICRELGISEQTFYRWKKKYVGMGIAEVRRLRILEEENQKLKQLVADLSLDKQMLQDVLRKSPEACSTAGRSQGTGDVLPGE
jgi:putative transposase